MSTDKHTIDQSLLEEIKTALENRGIPYLRWSEMAGANNLEYFTEDYDTETINWDFKSDSNILDMHLATVRIYRECDGRKFQLVPEYNIHKKNAYKHPIRSGVTLTRAIREKTAYASIVRGLAEDLGESAKAFKDPHNYRMYAVPHIKIHEPEQFALYPPLFKVIFHEVRHRIIINESHESNLYAETYTCQLGDNVAKYHWVEVEG